MTYRPQFSFDEFSISISNIPSLYSSMRGITIDTAITYSSSNYDAYKTTVPITRISVNALL